MKLYSLARFIFSLALALVIISCGSGGGDTPAGDTTPPNTIITMTPLLTNSLADVSFDFIASETNSTFEVSVDGGIYVAATSPYAINGLANGQHTVAIRATDEAGNTDATPASYTWTVGSPSINVTACAFTNGDSTQAMDGSAVFTKSHTQGSPVYRIVTSRQLADTTDVTVDYMVHEPAGTPNGVVVLIGGGNLDMGITGVIDGNPPTNSKGNFLVRSAHRYQSQGFRVITIDRPSNYLDYDLAPTDPVNGPTGAEMDLYRNSMHHAVDLATILVRENVEGYNVIISGTSRGSISAAANNTLASGIAMSSALTSEPFDTVATPVNTPDLPISRIERQSHVLLHTDEGCSYTTADDSRTLFADLDAQGSGVVGNEVSGGFRDTVRNDPCGAFDYHGYTGIEMCAVLKETDWMQNLITSFGINRPPVADSQSVNQGDTITLTATDADGDSMTFAVPYASSSLGGSVSTDANGNVTYTPPVGANGAIDTFAFTVTDGNGGVSTAVISITLM